MAVRSLLTDPDPRLRQVSAAVDAFDDDLRTLVEDLVETLRSSGAIGLSAPQIGVNERVLVVHVPDDDYGLRVYVNPQVLKTANPGYIEESCLSVPGIAGSVMRRTKITVQYQDPTGTRTTDEVDGLHAVCVQHEIDHLDGRLFTDRLAWFSRLRLWLSGGPALPSRQPA